MDLDRLAWLAAETPRLALQMGRTLAELPEYATLTEGTGHPVIFIPGLATGNGATFFMRRVLGKRNHKCFKWNGGHNYGITQEVTERFVQQVTDMAWEHEEPVTLVGQSLGGSIARVIANTIPEHIRSVVMLGSPVNSLQNVLAHAKDLYNERVEDGLDADDIWKFYGSLVVDNPPVPSTSIYSKTDGVVGWKDSFQTETNIAENVEVDAGHLTMGFDFEVIKIIADRIAQPAGEWEKYER